MATAAVVLGLNVRTRRAYLASVEERAAQLERERDQQGRLAAAAERARIAREMHDIVAHNLSVMIALADGAGYMADRDPQRAAGAMEQVSQTGRHALGEMRRLLGVLREDESTALAPQPGLADLEPLLEQVRAAGLTARAGDLRRARRARRGRGADRLPARPGGAHQHAQARGRGRPRDRPPALRPDRRRGRGDRRRSRRPASAAGGDLRSDLQAEVGTPRRSRPRTGRRQG